MHTDKKNLGPSAIIGLGDYQDGKLWGCASPTARRPLRSRPSAPAVNLRANPAARRSKGPRVCRTEFRAWVLTDPGVWLVRREEFGAVDIKGKWVEFDGNRPHCTLPFTGDHHDRLWTIFLDGLRR